MKKLFAIVLCAALLMSMSACGKIMFIQGYDTVGDESIVALTPAPTATPEPEKLDWAGAFAEHAPDEVVFTVNGVDVTWQEFFYELAACTTSLQLSVGTMITNWDAQLQNADGSTVEVGSYVLQNALNILYQYHAVTEELTKAGVTLSEEAKQTVQTSKQSIIDENFGGDKEQFLEYLGSLFCTEEVFDWFNEADQLYYEGFDYLYGANGEKLSDAEVLDYGVNNNYVQLKQFYCAAPADDTDEASDEASDEPEEEETVIDAELVMDALAAKKTIKARYALFDQIYASYNQNPELDVYGSERAVCAGDVDDAIYETAQTLEEYAYAVVDVNGVNVIIMRTALSASAPVYVDAADGTLRDLRYCAAWQAYTDRISGTGGWIESANIEFAEGFQTFNLNELFGVE